MPRRLAPRLVQLQVPETPLHIHSRSPCLRERLLARLRGRNKAVDGSMKMGSQVNDIDTPAPSLFETQSLRPTLFHVGDMELIRQVRRACLLFVTPSPFL